VRYALTVPQSVLFADISLRGSCRQAFREVFGTDYKIGYVVIDDGAMSWDFTGDTAFAAALLGTTDVRAAVRRFVAAMGATARAVEKTSQLVAPGRIRRDGATEDLLADLRQYWDAYERHMTSLFTFWNVEELLSFALTESLRDSGLGSEIETGLERFLQPSETNYFAIERRRLGQLAARFGSAPKNDPGRRDALAQHVSDFGFLLAPFNLGVPPSASSLEERLSGDNAAADAEATLVDGRSDTLADLPEPARELGLMAQELTFWKTERLDVMARADAQATNLYRAVSETLAIDTDRLFAMRRDEIVSSLRRGEPAVDDAVLAGRLEGYCLLLDGDRIEFFAPTRKPADVPHSPPSGPQELRGLAASKGVASGRVRLLLDLADVSLLEPGEILVTTMTRPEMGVALDRAAAFVTDQGGRMAHAAIIAREMGKPCVIGTDEATAVLHNGMSVTVDGDLGIVIIDDDRVA
jgi:phosphohistidine swiveling domain-containing protein